MLRSKKTKFIPSSSSAQTDFRFFLKNPTLNDDSLRLSQLEILPGRFVNYEDFHEYDIELFLQKPRLHTMFFTESRQGYYLFLLHLVYTNFTYEDNDDIVQLSSLVKGVHVKLTPKSLGVSSQFLITAY